MTTGRQAKAEGIAQVLGNPEVAPWAGRAHRALRLLARTGTQFTSEDVTQRVGQPPSSGAVGALMNTAAREGWIRRVGFGQADRANQHAALISKWVGVYGKVPDPDAALEQFGEHREDHLIPNPVIEFGRPLCGTCKGYGGTVQTPCKKCHGTGLVR